MPPKKSKTQNAKPSTTNSASKQPSKRKLNKNDNSIKSKKEIKNTAQEDPVSIPSKRKAKTPPTTTTTTTPKRRKNPPQEPSRHSVRSAPKPPITQTQILKFLLTQEAISLLLSSDESTDLQNRGPDLITYSGNLNTLTPFQELVCAVILSRPISHVLGLRTIRTIFNEPYCWNTPQRIRNAGEEGRRQAFVHARTQYKGKTADLVVEKGRGDGLEGVRGIGRDGEGIRKVVEG
ncbi:MAG: hypothetical protein M1812_002937 [Candelaria pacifica]|nr:MAG: hypothetical protein M1812_002937 [Candelaria pacifica]